MDRTVLHHLQAVSIPPADNMLNQTPRHSANKSRSQKNSTLKSSGYLPYILLYFIVDTKSEMWGVSGCGSKTQTKGNAGQWKERDHCL